jgi:hypothetical protein
VASVEPFISRVVGRVDLQLNQLHSQLQGLTQESKLVGLRHIVQSDPDETFLLQPKFLRGISLLVRHPDLSTASQEEYLASQTAGVGEKVFGTDVQRFYELKFG